MAGLIQSRPIRVVLAGWYGSANFGDEMLLATTADWVREAGGTPIAISVHPNYTRKALGIDSVPYTGLAEIVEAMVDADLFVLGGGGLFQDYDRLDAQSMVKFPARDATQFAQFFHLAKELGLPTVALAQGVGPLRADASRAVAAAVFRDADRVSVRDTESAALLKAIGVTREIPVGADPAWAYGIRHADADLVALIPSLRGRKVLGVNLRNWPFDESWESQFASAFATAFPADWTSVWVDFQRTPTPDGSGFVDDEIASRMVSRLRRQGDHVTYNPGSMQAALATLGSCDAVLAMRYHAVLTGHRARKPVVAIEYDDKVRALGDALLVPGELRVPLRDIPGRLPRAIGALTGPGRKAFVVSGPTIESQLQSALVHRQILHEAMVAASENRLSRPRPPGLPPLLRQWLQYDPALSPRIMASLATARTATRAQ
jgi:polysaccharide pyruvyl transferase CsaB